MGELVNVSAQKTDRVEVIQIDFVQRKVNHHRWNRSVLWFGRFTGGRSDFIRHVAVLQSSRNLLVMIIVKPTMRNNE